MAPAGLRYHFDQELERGGVCHRTILHATAHNGFDERPYDNVPRLTTNMSLTGVIVAAVFVGLAILVVAVIRWEIPRWKRGLQVYATLAQMAEQKMAENQAASEPPPPPLMSPDGTWWWDGLRWQPTELQQRGQPPTS
ncbi:MAG TPA: hypothetical protein VND96_06880 [Candidatus Micrarchaeaceae archaeon]|nr:hypothetical protein [Candidatus Micrarchaeaceae archaeon]